MVFLLGMISALILNCVCLSCPYLFFYLWLFLTSDAVLGALTMFAFGVGYGCTVDTFRLWGRTCTQSRDVDGQVKYFFGVLLLGVAIEIFATLEWVNSLFLWGGYAVGIAIYLGATEALIAQSTGWQRLQKAFATIVLIWGTLLLIGAGYGEHNLWKPLPQTTIETATVVSHKFPFSNIANMLEYETKREEAIEKKKMMIVFFYTDTCPVCKRLKAITFKDSRVRQELNNNYIAVAVNMSDKSDKYITQIKEKFQVFGPPSFVFIDAEGEIIKEAQFYGYQAPTEFYDTLDMLAE
ncbi:MAG: thioredoxin fold domain-containing protein [Sulfurovum sp.]|nr:thioredoxin fold domain-containing protein [Sulfurovum sp.]